MNTYLIQVSDSSDKGDLWSFYIKKETEVIKVLEEKFTLQTLLVLKKQEVLPLGSVRIHPASRFRSPPSRLPQTIKKRKII